jgi:hypothetical protein
MSESATVIVPALPTFLPRPAGIPVAPFSMQKILSKVIRSHADNQNLANTKVKGPDKMGGKRGGTRAGRAGRSGKTATATATRK